MSWAKRNLYFLISGIVAVVLLIASGWYCYSSMQSNSAVWAQLQESYGKMKTISDKPLGAGNEAVNNIEAAKQQAKEVQARVADMQKFFVPVRGIPNTNHLTERMLGSAVRDTISQLRAAAQSHTVTLPVSTPEFAFSFTLQASKFSYDANSQEMLSKQLGEVKLICDTLFACRINALDAVQRERTADDVAGANGGGASANDYTDSISLTNENVVITPYQVTFECFTPELARIISSFANQEHTVVVKTLNLLPADLNPGGDVGMMGGYPGGGYPGGGYPGGGYPGGGYPATAQPVVPGRGLPTAVDEKKLKVTMQLDFVKIIPTQGR